jgi:DNA replication protein DnaC
LQTAARILHHEHVPAPDGWTKTFTDPRLCAAIVDRLTFGGNIIETGTDSYRLAQTRARAAHAIS